MLKKESRQIWPLRIYKLQNFAKAKRLSTQKLTIYAAASLVLPKRKTIFSMTTRKMTMVMTTDDSTVTVFAHQIVF